MSSLHPNNSNLEIFTALPTGPFPPATLGSSRYMIEHSAVNKYNPFWHVSAKLKLTKMIISGQL